MCLAIDMNYDETYWKLNVHFRIEETQDMSRNERERILTYFHCFININSNLKSDDIYIGMINNLTGTDDNFVLFFLI